MRTVRTALISLLALSSVAATPDLGPIAHRVVIEAVGVKEGDMVVIAGDQVDFDVLTELSLEAAKVGAHPLVQVGREADATRFMTEVPAKYDTVAPGWAKAIAGLETVVINVGGVQDPSRFKDWPADRIAARSAAFQPVFQETLRRNVRAVWLGNGMYPTDGAARDIGISRDELSTLFWKGIDIDYAALADTGNKVAGMLRNGKEIRITHKNGTDLRMRIEARPVTVSDGVISAEDVTAGGASVQTYLPAGEVLLVGVPGTAEGKVVFDRAPAFGSDAIGWTLTVKAGKVTAMTATSGLDLVQKGWDVAPACKDELALLDIGINPNVPSTLLTFVGAGMISIGWGANDWAGGSNACPYGNAAFLPGSTVKVDKKVLIDQGRLVIPTS